MGVKWGRKADDKRDVNRVLSVCPTCAWPILEEVGQCIRCRPIAPPEPEDETSLDLDDEIVRTVAGQMPSMEIFSETQQVSSAEKRSELAWREAQLAARQRHRRERASRLPTFVAGIVIVLALVGAAALMTGGDKGGPTIDTPASDLPWRLVPIGQGSAVELPGAPVASTTGSQIGPGTRVSTNVPGAAIEVTAYRLEANMRGPGAAAIELLQARAADLGDDHVTGRIQQNRDRWGQAYDLTVTTDDSIARLRAVVVDSKLFFIETVGPQTTRTTQIFSRVINTLAPKAATA
jgi:hypothetical protein